MMINNWHNKQRSRAVVIVYNVISRRILSVYEKVIGGLIEILRINPNKIPEKVVNAALSFKIVS